MLSRNVSRLLIIVLMATAIAVTIAVPAFAAEPAPDPTGQLNTIIGKITAWVVAIAFGVATLFATIGFLRYLAAGGDPTEVEKAKSAWKNAAIGYAGAVLAPILLAFV
jgi:hypothetical protein